MLKKFLFVLLAGFLLLLLALGIFLVTFDADRYRQRVATELQQALGQPVRLDRLALGFRGGLAVQLLGFAIYDGTDVSGEPLLEVDSASALIAIRPLLRKDVQVYSLLLRRPRIHVARDRTGRINLLGLAAAAPSAAGAPGAPGGTPAGGAPGVSFRIARVSIEDGELHWTDAMMSPPTDLRLSALHATLRNLSPGQPMDVEASGALGSTGSGLQLKGRLTPPAPGQPGSIEGLSVSVEQLALEQVMPASAAGEPQLRGRLTARVEGAAPTLDPAQWTRALSARGRLRLAEPVLVNLNLLRAVFERFSMIPGLVQTLESRLPPDYRAKFAARDTVLSPIDVEVGIEHGMIRFDALDIRTDTFVLSSGAGTVGLDGALDIEAALLVDPTFSAALIKSVNELQYLANRQGELDIPLAIRGTASRVAVLPDLKYVASKLLVTKVQDLLGTFLQRSQEN